MSDKTEETGPVEVPAVSQMGATFAERAKARTKAEKAVSAETDEVEDKAVTPKKASAKSSRKS